MLITCDSEPNPHSGRRGDIAPVPLWAMYLAVAAVFASLPTYALGQIALSQAASLQSVSSQSPAQAGSKMPAAESLPIQAGDQIGIKVLDVPELDQPGLMVTDRGEVPLQLVGNVFVKGLSPAEAADKIAKIYMERSFLRDAHVAVRVENYSSSSSVSVFGYVIGASSTAGTTGVSVPISAPRPLLAVLSMAGGLSERASRTVTIQRRDKSIPPFSVTLPNNPLLSQLDNTLIYPGDIVIVPRAGYVYVLGSVVHSSAVLMSEDGRISLMQALSQVGSPVTSASLELTVFRKTDGRYQAMPVNLGKIVKGRQPDIELQAEDVIWVPFSFGKNLLVNGATITAALASASATGIIYTH